MLKSQTIMKVLVTNERSLCGRVNIGGYTVPNLENKPCEMIRILRGERTRGWDGKWLFTESGELVSPKDISKHDISIAIYGMINPDSVIFKLFGFKGTEADEVEDLKKNIPQKKLDAFFESELRQRYGISPADLNDRYLFKFRDSRDFLKPEAELDPVNLCLCPNCATTYRKLRADASITDKVRKAFLTKSDTDIEAGDYVAVAVTDEDELWFTQTHFAEIRELLLLTKKIDSGNAEPPIQVSADDEGEKSGLSVYSAYIGKTIHRKDGFVATVEDVTSDGKDTYLNVHVTGGKDAGKDTRIQLSFILRNRNVYTVSDK